MYVCFDSAVMITTQTIRGRKETFVIPGCGRALYRDSNLIRYGFIEECPGPSVDKINKINKSSF
ncbi:hypothetical protein BPAE_0049g00050 [Botrytis paeoniae]|uniref:Uncharacterized protein n=1 Tax=Botrytis paeoniae TaxID=278948 RepID=A0A4Z1FVP5_9HELO|nr:hypothetical protein BPAE_0049g00050 [Botrytis paeoniae]